MKILELIEGRMGFLYHSMDLLKSHYVFATDIMPAFWTHTIPGLGTLKGNSFSRNRLLRYNFVTITVDQAKLAYNNRIIPLDGNYVHQNRKKDPNQPVDWIPRLSDRSHDSLPYYKKMPKHFLQEEFVVGEIRQLHRKIVQIDIRLDKDFGFSRDPTKKEFTREAKFIQDYANKYGIKFNVGKGIKLKEGI